MLIFVENVFDPHTALKFNRFGVKVSLKAKTNFKFFTRVEHIDSIQE